MIIFVVASDPDVPGLCVAYDTADRVARAMCMPDLILIVDPVLRSVYYIRPKESLVARQAVEDFEEIYYRVGSEYYFLLGIHPNTLGDTIVSDWYYKMPPWCERDLIRPEVEENGEVCLNLYDHKPFGTA